MAKAKKVSKGQAVGGVPGVVESALLIHSLLEPMGFRPGTQPGLEVFKSPKHPGIPDRGLYRQGAASASRELSSAGGRRLRLPGGTLAPADQAQARTQQ